MLPVGKIAKPFGLEGELLVNLYDTFPAEPDHKEPLYVRIDTLAVPLFIEKFERRGRSGARVRFADIDTEVRAAELVGHEVFRKEAVTAGTDRDPDGERPDDELYFEDLVGFRALLGDGVTGVVEQFIDNDLNPLLVVRTKSGRAENARSTDSDTEGREVLIPASEEFIAELDEEQREIVFDLPEGLLDLYL